MAVILKHHKTLEEEVFEVSVGGVFFFPGSRYYMH